MAHEDTIVARLGVTPEQLIGYAYAGLLATFIASMVEPKIVTQLVATLGGVLAAIVALALGVGIFALYFKILGELLLYPFHHFVHLGLDRLRGKIGLQHTSCVRYLGALGVPVGQRRAAYETVKALFFPDEERRRVQLAHGELHVLYLTAVESAAAAIYLKVNSRAAAMWFLCAGVCYISALVADLRQHALESFMLKSRSAKDLEAFLATAGYMKARVD